MKLMTSRYSCNSEPGILYELISKHIRCGIWYDDGLPGQTVPEAEWYFVSDTFYFTYNRPGWGGNLPRFTHKFFKKRLK